MVSPGRFLWDGCGAGGTRGSLAFAPVVQPHIPIDAILQDSAAPRNRPIHGTGSATTGMWALQACNVGAFQKPNKCGRSRSELEASRSSCP